MLLVVEGARGGNAAELSQAWAPRSELLEGWDGGRIRQQAGQGDGPVLRSGEEEEDKKNAGRQQGRVGIPIQSQDHNHLHSYTVHCESKASSEPPAPGEALSTFVTPVTNPSMPQRPHLLH